MKKILQHTAFVFAYTLSLGLMFFATPAAVQAQDAENLIINGDFATGNLDGWTPFVADWEGVQAAFGVIDGEAAITNHTGPRNVVWHVQLNQILTQAQIDALEVGQSYKVTFDARSPEAGRQLRMFFGEEGGGFAMVTEKNIALTTSMETNQNIYFEKLEAWTQKEGILSFFFEAFDEDWKGSPEPHEPEKHWGVFHIDRTPKMAVQKLYAKIRSNTSV